MTQDNDLTSLIEKQKAAAFNIKGAAGEINMISINAAIESAHAAAGIRTMMEKVLDGMMTTVCRMITRLLDSGSYSLDQKNLEEFARWVGIDEIYITNAEAVTVGSNLEAAYGWQFPEDPKAQAYVFRKLMESKDGVVTQPIKPRDLDSQMFKFVGVSRTDEPGIVQIGYRAETITKYQVEIGAVFGILASEIKNLGGRVTNASKAMQDMTGELEKQINN